MRKDKIMSAISPRLNPTLLLPLNRLLSAFLSALSRLDKSLNPSTTLSRLRTHPFTPRDATYLLHIFLASFWLTIMQFPAFPLKLAIPVLYAVLLLIPLTSQFFLPFVPVASWILTFYTSRFIPTSYRPTISVSLLPTLETVLYGANVSDILTRFTHPVLDIVAWLPYGVIHFVFPFVVAFFLWIFRPKPVLHLWARTFGYMNLIGVFVQILLPCAAPWYELIYGLTPANYSMPGSAGGLARIDALFHSHGYETTFSNSPVVFGAFPSLHSACATIEALFLSHFFPATTKWIWGYAGVLYWATMYLTHHYLIDVVGGACLATACFYLFLPDELKGPAATASSTSIRNGMATSGSGRSKYAIYDLEEPRSRGGGGGGGGADGDYDDYELESESDELGGRGEDEEMDITFRSPVGSATPFISAEQKVKVSGEEGKRSHRHTASIASLIRADERVEDGWSPIVGSFAFGKAEAEGKV